MKIGDLVRCVPGAAPMSRFGDENALGIVIEINVNMWGEEVIPSGARVLWSEDITVESEDELEVINESR